MKSGGKQTINTGSRRVSAAKAGGAAKKAMMPKGARSGKKSSMKSGGRMKYIVTGCCGA